MMWLAGVERIGGNSGGSMTGDGSRKLLLHSTEGSTIEGAVGAYRAHNSWPHLTVDCPRRRVVQHLPLDVAARALRNHSGGVQTNREGTICVQVELVGTATDPSSIGSAADLDWFGSEVVAPIARLTGVPLRSSVTWAAYPGSYGLGAGQRLSASAWDAYSGLLGHMHAPENTHGDPGALDVDRILAAAGGSTSTPEEWDTMASKNEIKAAVREVLDEGTGRGQTNWAGTSAKGLALLVEVVRKVRELPTGHQVFLHAAHAINETGVSDVQVDEAQIAEAIAAAVREDLGSALADLSPEAIAAAIPDGLAGQVADELAGRLAG